MIVSVGMGISGIYGNTPSSLVSGVAAKGLRGSSIIHGSSTTLPVLKAAKIIKPGRKSQNK